LLYSENGVIRGSNGFVASVTLVIIFVTLVTESVDSGLLSENLLANGAGFACGETILSAGSVLTGGNNLGVTLSLDYFLLYKGFMAGGADLACGEAVFFTGCVFTFNVNCKVAERRKHNGDLVTASGAGDFLCAVLGAGGTLDCVSVVIGVRNNVNYFLFNSNCAANGALLTFGKTGFGAGSCLAGNNNFLVAGSGFFGVVNAVAATSAL
jgi:hypothetical protein